MGLSGGFLLNRYRLPSEIPYAANKNLTKEIPMAEQWLTSLITDTPQEGYELAIALSPVAYVILSPIQRFYTDCALSMPRTPASSLLPHKSLLSIFRRSLQQITTGGINAANGWTLLVCFLFLDRKKPVHIMARAFCIPLG